MNSVLSGDLSAAPWAGVRDVGGELRDSADASAQSFDGWLARLAARLLSHAGGPFDHAITQALSQLTEFMGVDGALLMRFAPDDAALRITHAWAAGAAPPPEPASLVDSFPWLLGQVECGHEVPVLTPDELPREAAIDRSSLQCLGAMACLAVPLHAAGLVKGALFFASLRRERTWPDALVERTRVLADVFAGALAHQRLREELDVALGFERKAAEILRSVTEAPDAQQAGALEVGLGEVARALGTDRATLWQLAEGEGQLRQTHQWLAHGLRVAPDSLRVPCTPWVSAQLERGAVVSIAARADCPPEAAADLQALRELHIGAAVFVPLKVSGRVAGALSVAVAHERRAWPPELVSRLQLLGEAFALFLARREAEGHERKAQAHVEHAARVGAMGVFAASLVHELTQPLAANLSNAQTAADLLDASAPGLDDLRATVSDIVADSRRCGEMIQQLRRLLRHGEAARSEFDPGALLVEVLALVGPQALERGIGIDLNASPGLSPIVGDRSQIQQVLANLLLNALDAVADTSPCERRVEVRAHASDNGVRIEIADHGVGMDATTLAQIFRPFFTTKPDGLGLGLSISRTIIANHGARLSVQSEKGAGSTFRLDFPARHAVIRLLPVAVPASRLAESVFVIDDDDAMRRALARQLQTQGYRVGHFASADDFLEQAPQAEVACIVSDMRMAGMTGLELQARLERSEVRWPIVFMSGCADIPTTVHAIKAGAVAFLAKPFEKAELLSAVAEAIARSRADHRDRRRDADVLARYACLTPRESDVFALVSAGLLNKLIADRLGIAESTVKIHRARMMDKMGANSVADLVRMAQHLPAGELPRNAPRRAGAPELERL